jgi:hypothetical protein
VIVKGMDLEILTDLHVSQSADYEILVFVVPALCMGVRLLSSSTDENVCLS